MADITALDFLVGKFRIPGDLVSAVPHGSGHINDTYVATYEHAGRRTRYIHQKLNTHVLPDPVAVMDNVSRVVAHLKRKASESAAGPMKALELVPAADGRPFYVHDGTQYWRTFDFVEGAKTVDVAESPDQVRNAAAAIGRFQRLLGDLPPPRLKETIPGFHDTAKHFDRLLAALDADTADRATHCTREVEFARTRAGLAAAISRQLAAGAIPERISHNDTKLNNVMLDADTGVGVCVIDLDTVMPGSVLYDFGDLVRTATTTCPEDEADLGKVRMNIDLFAAIAEGYLASTVGWLEDAEIASLVLSGRVITFECGIRFLADFLNGDTYFRTAYPEHNLVRCRSQFALLEDLEARSDDMEATVRQALTAGRSRRDQ